MSVDIMSQNIDELVAHLQGLINEAERQAQEDCARYEDEMRGRVHGRMDRLYAELRAPRAQLDEIWRTMAKAESLKPFVMQAKA